MPDAHEPSRQHMLQEPPGDRLCTFCAIPSMRGKHISKPIEEIVREAKELIRDGVRELILVAQDTTYYGLDLYGEVHFNELLRELERLDVLPWIRILYVYPMYVGDELISTIAESKRIVPYLDMPLQHINDRMLRRVGRADTREEKGSSPFSTPRLRPVSSPAPRPCCRRQMNLTPFP